MTTISAWKGFYGGNLDRLHVTNLGDGPMFLYQGIVKDKEDYEGILGSLGIEYRLPDFIWG